MAKSRAEPGYPGWNPGELHFPTVSVAAAECAVFWELDKRVSQAHALFKMASPGYLEPWYVDL